MDLQTLELTSLIGFMFSEFQVAHKEYWYCRFIALCDSTEQQSGWEL
jgi:hypothetical protein